MGYVKSLGVLVILIGTTALAGAAAPGSGSGGEQASAPESLCVTDCGDSPDLTCEGATCTSVERDCAAGQRGYLVCDGVTTYCPTCPVCESGEIKKTYTSLCCSNPRVPEGVKVWVYFCSGGQWSTPYSGCEASTAQCVWP
jgi:hypothetical protein